MIVLLVEFFALLLIGALGVWAVSGRTSWSGVSTRKRRAPRELPPPQPTAFTASTGSYDPWLANSIMSTADAPPASSPASQSSQQASFPPAKSMGWAPEPTASVRRRWGGLVKLILLALVVAAGASLAVKVLSFVHSHAPIHLPETIGGFHQIHDGYTQASSDHIRSGMERAFDLSVDVAYYGGADQPTITVAVMRASGSSASAQEIWKVVTADFASTQVFLVNSKMKTQTTGDETTVCAPFRGRLEGSACSWKDSRSSGFVLDLHPGMNYAQLFINDVRTAIFG